MKQTKFRELYDKYIFKNVIDPYQEVPLRHSWNKIYNQSKSLFLTFTIRRNKRIYQRLTNYWILLQNDRTAFFIKIVPYLLIILITVERHQSQGPVNEVKKRCCECCRWFTTGFQHRWHSLIDDSTKTFEIVIFDEVNENLTWILRIRYTLDKSKQGSKITYFW